MSTPASPSPLHVLLVEDHADSARALAALLQAWGHRVSVAATVAAAWDAVEEAYLERDDFQVLIADIMLPDGNGRELMRELSGLFPLKGIAVSGLDSEADVERSLEAGFEWHLGKPIAIESLAHSLVASNAA
jgi:CheY-like chemotaxis protein